MKITPPVLAVLLFCTFTVFGPFELVFADSTNLASRGAGGADLFRTDADELSRQSASGVALSGDGRYVAYSSRANNIVPGEDDYPSDVFLFDRVTGTTMLVSGYVIPVSGEFIGGDSYSPSLSGDGRVIAFLSESRNLVAGENPTDFTEHVYVRDMGNGVTERLFVPSSGGFDEILSRAPLVSANGRFVTFTSFMMNSTTNRTASHAYVYDRESKTVTQLSTAVLGRVVISGDGQWLAYSNDGQNVVENLSTRERAVINVCLPECDDGVVYEVDSISEDGRVVAVSYREDVMLEYPTGPRLVRGGGYLFDRLSGTSRRIGPGRDELPVNFCFDGSGERSYCALPHAVSLSGNGNFATFSLAYPLATGAGSRINVYQEDLSTGVVTLISGGHSGGASNCDSGASSDYYFSFSPLSSDGRVAAIQSCATNLTTETASFELGRTRVFVRVSDSVDKVDTDNDGTIDTADGCHLDPLKIAPGSCGCGAADTDANGNSVADCLDPKVESLVFSAPGIVQETYSTTLNIFMQPVDGVKYQIKLTLPPKKKKQPPRVSYYYSDQPTFALAGLKKKTKGTISYRAYLDGTVVLQSPESPAASFKVNKPKKLKKPRK